MTSRSDVRYPAGGGGGGGGAPTDATYVTLTANGDLSAEAVLGTSVVMADVLASRPAAATAGLLFFATDTKAFYRDTGASWVLVSTQDYVAKAGDSMTGALSIATTAATAAATTRTTGDTNARVRAYTDGRIYSAGDDRAPLGSKFTGVTGVAATNVLTLAGHRLQEGQPVRFTTLNGGAGLVNLTQYYVLASNVGAGTFKLRNFGNQGSPEIDFTTDITSSTIQVVDANVATDAEVFIDHSRPGLTSYGTGLRIRASVSTANTQPFAIDDSGGTPILYVLAAGGLHNLDTFVQENSIFNITERIGFLYRNSNGSGAIITQDDPIALIFGLSSQVWSGDPVPAGKQLGMGISRSNWVFTADRTGGSAVLTSLTGIPSGKTVPVGSIVTGTGILADTTVLSTTSTQITLSQIVGSAGSGTIICHEPDTLAIRAYNGIEIHGSDGAGGTAAGKIGYDNGLILSGDNDPKGALSGWKIPNNDKNFVPPANNLHDIGTASNRAKVIHAYTVRCSNSVVPGNGVANVDVGEAANHFRAVYADSLGVVADPIPVAYITSIVGTVNEGWVARENAWTRVGDTSFTVAVDVAARYQPGLKLSWVQNATVKYGVVASSSFGAGVTTVNLIPTTDYVLTSGQAITVERYSRVQNPQGWPVAFAYAPTHVGFSANPTHYAYWQVDGRKIRVEYRCTADGTSNAATYTVTAPVAVTTAITSYLAAAPLTFAVDGGATISVDTMTEGTPNTILAAASRRVYITGSTFTVASNMSTGQAWATSAGKRAIFAIDYWF